MREYKQAAWSEPNLFELSRRQTEQAEAAPSDILKESIPLQLLRDKPLSLPTLSEAEVVRHFTRLSQMTFAVDTGFYPLGSCTMKYNPKVNEAISSLDSVRWLHPDQPETTLQGALEAMHTLAGWLAEITGMDAVSLHPAAGAHGELAGILIIRAYHEQQGKLGVKREIIIPDSAHGTNFASAAMGGFSTVVVPTDEAGRVNIDALKAAVNERTAGLMLTNPNTLGIFEENIVEIAQLVHNVDGLLYYDGANLNAILGKARPGDMGFDIVHVNIHKTFATPHGGGGPGAGPIGVKKKLASYLPTPVVTFDGQRYSLNHDLPHSIGRIRGFLCNFAVLIRAYAYIRMLGAEGLERASELAVVNSNYLAAQLSKVRGLQLAFTKDTLRKHEAVFSCAQLKKDTNVTAGLVAKRLLDCGMHAPTVYFPPVVEEALMVEPTECETLEEMDRFVECLREIFNEAYEKPEAAMKAPVRTASAAVDEVKASHPKTLTLSWRMLQRRQREAAATQQGKLER